MTTDQFKNHQFTGAEKIIYQEQEYDLVAVDFEECLIGIYEIEGDDTVYFKRCENVELKVNLEQEILKCLNQQICYKSNKPCQHHCDGLCKESC